MTDSDQPHAVAARTALFAQMQAIAKRETLPFFRVPMTIDNKSTASGGYDPVTEADRGCEQALRTLIQDRFPQDGILGEEFGSVQLNAPFVWVIDPIDGTRAFVSGVPLWGMLVGLIHDGRPVAGLAYQPFIGEAFSTTGGNATWEKNGESQALAARNCASLDTATLMTTTPALFDISERRAYDALESQVRSVRYGTDWYAYALIASGTADLVVESGLSPYDILPLVPLIEAAGGAVVDWKGERLGGLGQTFGGQVLAVGDKTLIPHALEFLSPATR